MSFLCGSVLVDSKHVLNIVYWKSLDLLNIYSYKTFILDSLFKAIAMRQEERSKNMDSFFAQLEEKYAQPAKKRKTGKSKKKWNKFDEFMFVFNKNRQ